MVTAYGTRGDIYSHHGDMCDIHRSAGTCVEEYRKYNSGGDDACPMQTSVTCAKVQNSPRNRQQCLQASQLRMQQERFGITKSTIQQSTSRATLPQ